MSELRIAQADPGDYGAIIALHLENWQRHYRASLPARFLDDEAGPYLAARWEGRQDDPDWLVLTARRDDRLLGFVAARLDKPPEAFLDNLHVADAAAGTGIGRALMAALADRLAAAGFAALWLHVLTENTGARAFYARLGGVEGPARPHDVCGHPVTTHLVRWDGLSVLRDQPPPAGP